MALLDLFLVAGEMSGDAHGAELIDALLAQNPHLKIGAIAGPKMRQRPIQAFFSIEELSVMGFSDVIRALPSLIRTFFRVRNTLLTLNPKAIVFIDYPGFNLRLASSLRKKQYSGKLIHFICPTVWAWGKGRIPKMSQTLDLLLTLFPFEPAYFAHTSLPTHYIGHPLAPPIAQFQPQGKFPGKILAIFPGSRPSEIARNLPIQLHVANHLKLLDPTLTILVSHPTPLPNCTTVPYSDSYELMRSAHLAIATSGTVTLELALHKTPTVVTYAMNRFDTFLARHIFRIRLPHYCIANIILNETVFPEFFGPNLIPVPGNNFTFEQRESSRQIDHRKWLSIKSIQGHLRWPIFGALTCSNVKLFPGTGITTQALLDAAYQLYTCSDARGRCFSLCEKLSAQFHTVAPAETGATLVRKLLSSCEKAADLHACAQE